MRLEQSTTQILATCVQTSVECLFVGVNGPVKLHIRTLLQYDGQGRCRHMELFGETGNTYGDLLRTWATRVQWTVREERYSIVVTRPQEEENTIVAQETEDLQENTVPTIQQNTAGRHNTLAGGNLVHRDAIYNFNNIYQMENGMVIAAAAVMTPVIGLLVYILLQ